MYVEHTNPQEESIVFNKMFGYGLTDYPVFPLILVVDYCDKPDEFVGFDSGWFLVSAVPIYIYLT